MDDRKSKMMRDQREREKREAHAAAARQDEPYQSLPTPTSTGPHMMPGSGYTLGMSADGEHPNDTED
jgi:hypothetical protein